MNIVLIGTGNVASTLGPALHRAGHRIQQVVGRREEKAKILAQSLDSEWTTEWNKIKIDAHLYIIALSDSALNDLHLQLQIPSGLVVHTAGAVSKDVLKPLSDRYGVLYPLQSLKGTAVQSGNFPFLIDAAETSDIHLLQELVVSLGSVYQLTNDEQRLQMHLAAVWVNNFPNLLYSIAYAICREKELDFRLLVPLIRETALRIDGTDPWIWQTGPASRNDLSTIFRHRRLISSDPEQLQIYDVLSEAIISKVKI